VGDTSPRTTQSWSIKERAGPEAAVVWLVRIDNGFLNRHTFVSSQLDVYSDWIWENLYSFGLTTAGGAFSLLVLAELVTPPSNLPEQKLTVRTKNKRNWHQSIRPDFQVLFKIIRMF
jgi:hypothetical protein